MPRGSNFCGEIKLFSIIIYSLGLDHTHPDPKKNYVSRHEFFSFVSILGFVQNISKVAEVSLAKNILQQNKI